MLPAYGGGCGGVALTGMGTVGVAGALGPFNASISDTAS